MVAKGDNGKNLKVPGLIIKDKQALRRFARSIERKMAMFQRDTKFDDKNFKVEDYLGQLKAENIKLALD